MFSRLSAYFSTFLLASTAVAAPTLARRDVSVAQIEQEIASLSTSFSDLTSLTNSNFAAGIPPNSSYIGEIQQILGVVNELAGDLKSIGNAGVNLTAIVDELEKLDTEIGDFVFGLLKYLTTYINPDVNTVLALVTDLLSALLSALTSLPLGSIASTIQGTLQTILSALKPLLGIFSL